MGGFSFQGDTGVWLRWYSQGKATEDQLKIAFKEKRNPEGDVTDEKDLKVQ